MILQHILHLDVIYFLQPKFNKFVIDSRLKLKKNDKSTYYFHILAQKLQKTERCEI